MNNKLLLTYSLLAHLKDASNDPANSLKDLFIPLVQKSLSDYCTNNELLELRGTNYSEIHNIFKDSFDLDIPVPVLVDILHRVADVINNPEIFKVHNDGSYIIKSFVFDDIDSDVEAEVNGIKELTDDYELFCKSHNIECNMSDLEAFIRAQQIELFTDKKSEYLDISYHIPKYISLKFNDPTIFRVITRIYIGGIIANYFALKIDDVVCNAELLLDTNFIISLINLNTEDAYNTCSQLYTICQSMGFKFSILDSTVVQIEWLLSNRIKEFASKDSLGSVKENDVFAACIRRDLSCNDLHLIKNKIRTTLTAKYKIDIIYNARISKIIDEAKKTDKYKRLLRVRTNAESALNDAVAECYVLNKRGDERSINSFSDVKCWFLHNSQRSYYGENRSESILNRYTICADELLTMLWLSNPSQTTSISLDVIAKGGLSTYVTRYRNTKRPETKVIRDIKLRAAHLKEYGTIDEKDMYVLTARMAEGAISGEIANEWRVIEDMEFVKNVKNLSSEEEAMQKKIKDQNAQIQNLCKDVEDLKSSFSTISHKSETRDFEEGMRKYVDKELQRIRHQYPKHTIYYIILLVIVIALFVVNRIYSGLPLWLSVLIGVILLLIPLLLRFVDHNKLFKEIRYTFSESYKLTLEDEQDTISRKEYLKTHKAPEQK